MTNSINLSEKQKKFFDFLIQFNHQNQYVSSIQEISEKLGFSTATLREQMALAKDLGFISAQPKKGVEILPYKFTPAVSKSLYYAVNIDYEYFIQFAEIRSHLEKDYFVESAKMLDCEDLLKISMLVEVAFEKLNGKPVRIPHEEHRQYHLSFYSRQKNIFLSGILEAFWDVYEYVGLNLYADIDYLKYVWTYHKQILDLTLEGNYEEAYQLLAKHMEFIYEREHKQRIKNV